MLDNPRVINDGLTKTQRHLERRCPTVSDEIGRIVKADLVDCNKKPGWAKDERSGSKLAAVPESRLIRHNARPSNLSTFCILTDRWHRTLLRVKLSGKIVLFT